MFYDDEDPIGFDAGLVELETMSNGVPVLIKSGRFDEAESVCLKLRERFPDQIDWIEHSAALCEARGQVGQAIRFYRKCVAHIDRYPDGFDSDVRTWYRDQVVRLQSGRVRPR